ncbi:hypothetical protein O6H91_05G062900 [Diphasiastrum complanatum]|uniref:Uncharacterized protein n=1 Tax=Diphasiastrum complanatum TaxID=34168 RepID=A0ACC2DNV6_DIPCM|nr:hypothetical protein O6H91_05G062900 [Diphasiastrum complanatum]
MAAALKGLWYGPLVELADAAAHVGDYVQLVVFVLQYNHSQIIKNIRNVPVNKATMLVGDRTRIYFKVVLWQVHASTNICAGDIVFLQNMKVREYRGQIEALTVQHSTVKTLVQRAALLSSDGKLQKTLADPCGPIVHEKLKSVAYWARQTQMTLLSFLVETPLHHDMSTPLDLNKFLGFAVTPYEHEGYAREQLDLSSECSLLADAASCMESRTMKFFAHIGEISLPFVHKGVKSSTKLSFASQTLFGNSAHEFVRALLCIGCTLCDLPLDHDINRVYIRCTCTTQPINAKSISWIYRPFLVHVWDGSGQISILVKNKVAVKMFADVKAEDVFQSFCDRSNQTAQPEAGIGRTDGSDFTESLFEQNSSSCKPQKDVTERTLTLSSKIDYGILLQLLLRILISKDNHSPFELKVSCHIDKDATIMYRCFELISFRIVQQ